jgi:hypothetical protein
MQRGPAIAVEKIEHAKRSEAPCQITLVDS